MDILENILQRVETIGHKQDGIAEDMAVVKSQLPYLTTKVEEHETLVNQSKGSIRTLKWILISLLIPLAFLVAEVYY